MRVSVRLRDPAAQTAPGATATLEGPPPAGTVCSTLASSSLRRNATSSGVTVAHTEPPATARALIQPWSVTRAAMRSAAGSIFSTRPFWLLGAQSAPSANASSVAETGSGKRCCTRPLPASTRTTSGPLASQTDPAPTAIPVGSDTWRPCVCTCQLPEILRVRGVDPDQPRAALLGDEHRAAARGHPARREGQADAADLLATGHVNLREPLRSSQQRPRRAPVEGQVGWALGQRDEAGDSRPSADPRA